jgi:hypothetical protein
VAGGEQSRLRAALEHLLRRRLPWKAEEKAGVLDLLYHICVAAGIDEGRCADIRYSYKEAMAVKPGPGAASRVTAAFKLREAMEKVNEVLGRFELRGRCLVEKGVGVEDPSICEGDLDSGLLVIGSRMQFFVDGRVRGAVARAGGVCSVAVGESSAWAPWVLDELKAGRLGLLNYDEDGAVILVPCGLGDVPRLAGRAAEMRYREIYEEIYSMCKAFGDDRAESEALSKAEKLELDSCLELLGALEGGGGS